jgi:hypothetical protein
MVSPGYVGCVLRAYAGHVAAGAIRIIRVVICSKLFPRVAGEALGLIELNALLLRRREVGVVTTRAGHRSAATPLAHALIELFHFADAASGNVLFLIDEVAAVFTDRISGPEVEHGTPSTIN